MGRYGGRGEKNGVGRRGREIPTQDIAWEGVGEQKSGEKMAKKPEKNLKIDEAVCAGENFAMNENLSQIDYGTLLEEQIDEIVAMDAIYDKVKILHLGSSIQLGDPGCMAMQHILEKPPEQETQFFSHGFFLSSSGAGQTVANEEKIEEKREEKQGRKGGKINRNANKLEKNIEKNVEIEPLSKTGYPLLTYEIETSDSFPRRIKLKISYPREYPLSPPHIYLSSVIPLSANVEKLLQNKVRQLLETSIGKVVVFNLIKAIQCGLEIPSADDNLWKEMTLREHRVKAIAPTKRPVMVSEFQNAIDESPKNLADRNCQLRSNPESNVSQTSTPRHNEWQYDVHAPLWRIYSNTKREDRILAKRVANDEKKGDETGRAESELDKHASEHIQFYLKEEQMSHTDESCAPSLHNGIQPAPDFETSNTPNTPTINQILEAQDEQRRYERDFETIRTVSTSVCETVYLARHRLDMCFYIVKKYSLKNLNIVTLDETIHYLPRRQSSENSERPARPEGRTSGSRTARSSTSAEKPADGRGKPTVRPVEKTELKTGEQNVQKNVEKNVEKNVAKNVEKNVEKKKNMEARGRNMEHEKVGRRSREGKNVEDVRGENSGKSEERVGRCKFRHSNVYQYLTIRKLLIDKIIDEESCPQQEACCAPRQTSLDRIPLKSNFLLKNKTVECPPLSSEEEEEEQECVSRTPSPRLTESGPLPSHFERSAAHRGAADTAAVSGGVDRTAKNETAEQTPWSERRKEGGKLRRGRNLPQDSPMGPEHIYSDMRLRTTGKSVYENDIYENLNSGDHSRDSEEWVRGNAYEILTRRRVTRDWFLTHRRSLSMNFIPSVASSQNLSLLTANGGKSRRNRRNPTRDGIKVSERKTCRQIHKGEHRRIWYGDVKKIQDKITAQAEVLSLLQHAYLVRYHQCWVEPAQEAVYIQSEKYAPNENSQMVTLAEEMKKNESNFTPQVIWTYFRQVVDLLVYIHRRGVLHRSIHPNNLYIGHDAFGPNIKVGGFGLDAFLRSVRTPGGLILEGDFYDEDADMFCLGLLFFEMWYSVYHRSVSPLCSVEDALLELVLNSSFPPQFEASTPPNVLGILKLLIFSPKPISAFDLLNSSLIPPALDRETLKLFLSQVVQPASDESIYTMKLLFAKAIRALDLTASDRYLNNAEDWYALDVIREGVLEYLEEYLTSLGAYHYEIPPLLPRWEGETDEAFLSPHNLPLSLRRSLLYTFSLTPILSPRYTFANVFSPSTNKHGWRGKKKGDKLCAAFEMVLPKAGPASFAEIVSYAIDSLAFASKYVTKLRVRWTYTKLLPDLLQECYGLSVSEARALETWFREKHPDVISFDELKQQLISVRVYPHVLGSDETIGTGVVKQLLTVINYRGTLLGLLPKVTRLINSPKCIPHQPQNSRSSITAEVLESIEETNRYLELLENEGCRILFSLCLKVETPLSKSVFSFEIVSTPVAFGALSCRDLLAIGGGWMRENDSYFTEYYAANSVVNRMEANRSPEICEPFASAAEWVHFKNENLFKAEIKNERTPRASLGFEIHLDQLMQYILCEEKKLKKKGNAKPTELLLEKTSPLIIVTTQAWKLQPKAFALTNTLIRKNFPVECRLSPLVDNSVFQQQLISHPNILCHTSIQGRYMRKGREHCGDIKLGASVEKGDYGYEENICSMEDDIMGGINLGMNVSKLAGHCSGIGPNVNLNNNYNNYISNHSNYNGNYHACYNTNFNTNLNSYNITNSNSYHNANNNHNYPNNNYNYLNNNNNNFSASPPNAQLMESSNNVESNAYSNSTYDPIPENRVTYLVTLNSFAKKKFEHQSAAVNYIQHMLGSRKQKAFNSFT